MATKSTDLGTAQPNRSAEQALGSSAKPWLIAGAGATGLVAISAVLFFVLRGDPAAKPAADKTLAASKGPEIAVPAPKPIASAPTVPDKPATPIDTTPKSAKEELPAPPAVQPKKTPPIVTPAPEVGDALVPPPEKKTPEKAPPIPTVVPDSADVQDALGKQIALAGSLRRGSRTQSTGINSTTTFRQWIPRLQVDNQSAMQIEFGNDLLLYELNANSSVLEGVAVTEEAETSLLDAFAVMDGKPGPSSPAVTTHSTYGLIHNWESNGARWTVSGSTFNVSFGGGASKFGGMVQPGAAWRLDRTLEQGTWLRDELCTSVLLVLPEVRVKTTTGVEKFRWLAYFQKPATGDSWTLGSQRTIPMRKASLQTMLESPESNLVTRVLAANFLAAAHPTDAVAPLVATAKNLTEGDLLATCLELLTALKGDGLAPHALKMLQSGTAPNGIRARSARYLGVVRHEPALDPLVKYAKDADRAIAAAATSGLGDFGGPLAVTVLLAMLKDASQSLSHPQIAVALTRTKDAKAVAALQGMAPANASALDALVNAGLPETFDFFVDLSKKPKNREERDKITRGLRNSGKEKAFPILLDMLAKDTLPAPTNQYEVDVLVTELAKLITPTTLPAIAKMAHSGKVRAIQILAQSKDDSAREPLTELAAKTTGISQVVAVAGLANHWPTRSADVFAKVISSDNEQVVQEAIRGLSQSKEPRTFALLLPLLEHKQPTVRQTAGYTIQNHPAGDKLPQLASVLLKSTDDQLVPNIVKILIDNGWKDKTAVPKLGARLQSSKSYVRHEFVRLLRHLSANAMGPADSNEYYQNEENWVRRWVEWAKSEKNAQP